MDEDELRGALRATMTITPPPPMASAAAVAAGHRAVRRRAAWAGTGLTAVLVAATALVVGAGLQHDASPPWPAAGPATSSLPPDLDVQAQARLGRTEELTSLLGQVVPPGWQLVGGRSLPAQVGAAPAADGSGTSWRYVGAVTLRKQGRTGELTIHVETPGNARPADPCALAQSVGSTPGPCDLVPVGPLEVAVVGGKSADGLTDQLAAYRYPDGTVVYLTQSRQAGFGRSNQKPLTALPLTETELAARAADPRFHLS